jgi:KEOPS complex subunit Cgi121
MTVRPCDIRQVSLHIDDEGRFLAGIRQASMDHGSVIVLLNADNMAGIAHAESAILHAFRAYREKTTISNSLEMEVLLYAAGSRQCSVATRFGIHRGWNRVYLCICPPDSRVWGLLCPLVTEVHEDWEQIDVEKACRLRELFSITPEELRAVGTGSIRELVLERVALLEVYR